MPTRPTAILLLVLLAAVSMRPALAHEIPADVTVRLLVREEAGRLLLLARVPLEAMRDFDFPVRGAGYLDVGAARPLVRDAAVTWVGGGLRLYADGRPLPSPRLLTARVSLPADRSFAGFAEALSHVTGPPLQESARVVPEHALLDALFEIPLGAAGADLALESDLSLLGLRTTTVLRFLPADGSERAFRYAGDPGRVQLDPGWWRAAASFVRAGFGHILGGVDHLLFLLCLVIPFRRLRPLVLVITAFTVAHSVTLLAAVLGVAPDVLWFPPLVETLIAASILYMALENIVGPQRRRRWVIAFAFGLVHGFGFSFALRETLQFAGSHMLTSLLAFNVGVELGQLLVIAIAVPLVDRLFRHLVAERMGTILLSAIVAHSAWHWMTARGAELLAHDATLPALDARLAAAALRWVVLALVAAGALWALAELVSRLERPRRPARRSDEAATMGRPAHATQPANPREVER